MYIVGALNYITVYKAMIYLQSITELISLMTRVIEDQNNHSQDESLYEANIIELQMCTSLLFSQWNKCLGII